MTSADEDLVEMFAEPVVVRGHRPGLAGAAYFQ